MTREECEGRLLEKCKEMNDILKEYDPEAEFLSVSICPKKGYIGIFNNYWENKSPIDIYSYNDDTYSSNRCY